MTEKEFDEELRIVVVTIGNRPVNLFRIPLSTETEVGSLLVKPQETISQYCTKIGGMWLSFGYCDDLRPLNTKERKHEEG